jgi:hypothetical protein
MTITAKQLIAPQHITNTAATYYTATRVTGRADMMTATNTDTAAHTLTVHIVPSAGSAAAGNKIISAKSIMPGETYVCYEMLGQNIPSGSFIQALADANTAIVLTASGIEIS